MQLTEWTSNCHRWPNFFSVITSCHLGYRAARGAIFHRLPRNGPKQYPRLHPALSSCSDFSRSHGTVTPTSCVVSRHVVRRRYIRRGVTHTTRGACRSSPVIGGCLASVCRGVVKAMWELAPGIKVSLSGVLKRRCCHRSVIRAIPRQSPSAWLSRMSLLRSAIRNLVSSAVVPGCNHTSPPPSAPQPLSPICQIYDEICHPVNGGMNLRVACVMNVSHVCRAATTRSIVSCDPPPTIVNLPDMPLDRRESGKIWSVAPRMSSYSHGQRWPSTAFS